MIMPFHNRLVGGTFWGILLVASFLFTTPVFAQNQPAQYTPLVPLPGSGSGPVNVTQYIPQMFTIAIGIAGVLAVIMIMVGGIEYITADTLGGKAGGKEKINNAIIGLLLAIGAYIILYTVNPNALQFKLGNISAVTPTTPPPPPPPPPMGGGSNLANMCPFPVRSNSVPCTCTGCVTLSSLGVPAKSGIGGNVTTSFGASLQQLQTKFANTGSAGTSWQVTEAWPPTSTHQSACHNNGNCVDLNFNNNPPSATQITDMGNAAVAAGLSPSYEVLSVQAKNALIAAGVPASYISVNTSATAPHFHVH